MTTAQAIIDELRSEALNDSGKDRYTDARLLGYLNEALYEIALRRPDLFTSQGTVTTVAGVYQQAPTDSLRLMDVMQVQGGRVLRETDQESMDNFDPTWRAAAAAGEKNWMRYRKDPNRFMVNPPSAGGVVLVVLYASIPTALALADPFPLADAYRPAAKHYMVYKTEMPQDESILSGRAQMEFQAFEGSLGASVQTKALADDETSRKDRRVNR